MQVLIETGGKNRKNEGFMHSTWNMHCKHWSDPIYFILPIIVEGCDGEMRHIGHSIMLRSKSARLAHSGRILCIYRMRSQLSGFMGVQQTIINWTTESNNHSAWRMVTSYLYEALAKPHWSSDWYYRSGAFEKRPKFYSKQRTKRFYFRKEVGSTF